ncbi:uncharacterized protein N0V89_006449 [Didymosphaeria variabile]|uniref:Cytochrome P450 n=1 Tax=Didymosphaeria variabile TaxID=1932322 RepID=A0A9W8XJK0_9PLEO|nr:uncharacterized protein N0V89_006449 [Didymosphaeria variabile]KAJ4351110.1 hypothetical protein N0V89_006449 [Didymosphaeria variabile]
MTSSHWISVPEALGLFTVVLVGYGVAKAIYNVFFHPLRMFPGPKLHAATSMRQALSVVIGKPHENVLELHKKHGEVVRLGPNELSFSHEGAWKDICGHMKHGQAENGKDQRFASEVQDASLISASRERHGPLRRTLAHAFSAKAMAEQMPLINQYIDLLMQKLHEHGEYGRKPLNMVHWFDWTTFDIVGDLAFGEPFGCLDRGKAHPWVSLLSNAQKFIPLLQSLQDLPFFKALKPLYMVLYPPLLSAGKTLATSQEFADATVNKRIDLGVARPDFVEHMLKKRADYVSFTKFVLCY